VSWTAIAVMAAGAYAAKFAGMFLVGPRATSGWALAAIGILPPALLMALVAVQTFGGDRALVVDARSAGLAAAVLAVWRRLPFLAVVAIGAAVTAAVRAL
jgi:uncharacterized membrane protein